MKKKKFSPTFPQGAGIPLTQHFNPLYPISSPIQKNKEKLPQTSRSFRPRGSAFSNPMSPFSISHRLSQLKKWRKMRKKTFPQPSLRMQGFPRPYISIHHIPLKSSIQKMQKKFFRRDVPLGRGILLTE